MSTEVTVYQWNVICNDGSNNVSHIIWSPDTPDSCPHSTAGHTFVDALIISTVSTKDMLLKNNKQGTNGIFRTKGYDFNISAGVDSELVLKESYTFPYNARAADFIVCLKNENIDDVFSIIVDYNTIIGTITSNVSSGKVLNVSTSVITNMKVGYLVTINGSSYSQELYECHEIDTGANTITVEKDISNSFSIGDTIGIGIPVADRICVTLEKHMKLGNGINGTMLIPKGKVLSIFYKNSLAQAKTLCLIVEMFV